MTDTMKAASPTAIDPVEVWRVTFDGHQIVASAYGPAGARWSPARLAVTRQAAIGTPADRLYTESETEAAGLNADLAKIPGAPLIGRTLAGLALAYAADLTRAGILPDH